MRSQQDNSDSNDNLDDDSSQPSRDMSDIAYAVAAKGDIARAEIIREKYPDTLNSIGMGIQSHGGQQDYLEKIQILTFLQHPHTTHETIDRRAARIQESKLRNGGKWFMTKITNTTVTKAHNALSLRRVILSVTTDEACNLAHSGNWAALVLLANLVCGRINKNSDKSDFLPFIAWVRILEFTLGINNRNLTKPGTLQEIWRCSLMAHLGHFFSNVMQSKQTIKNASAPHLPLRRGHS